MLLYGQALENDAYIISKTFSVLGLAWQYIPSKVSFHYAIVLEKNYF